MSSVNLQDRLRTLPNDLVAGLVNGVASVPSSMATAALAGVNPVFGLYAITVAPAVGSLLASAGVVHTPTRFPHLKGRSLKNVMLNPNQDGPRGSVNNPGDGALLCWDNLGAVDLEWNQTGALKELSTMDLSPGNKFVDTEARLKKVGEKYGAPDFSKRTFYRAVVDGQYKLVRWFSPNEYGNPATLDELYATSDVTLHDLVNDPGELENIGHTDHPNYDPALVERMLAKLHRLVAAEIGEDRPPFDLDIFGTRDVTYR